MINLIGIVFDNNNRIFYYNSNNLVFKKGDKVVVETDRGLQLGIVSVLNFDIDSSKILFEVKNIERMASNDDLNTFNKNKTNSDHAIDKANSFIKELNLDMKILNASFTLDRKQLLFNFTADSRIDFRILAKKIASIYKTRIELRQIGVRDKSSMLGGLGQCGRRLCCNSFLNDINSVSINMAKNQGIALNPQKINGVCGRLMCCLNYENSSYSDYYKGLPKIGEKITINGNIGRVIYVDIFKRIYKVQYDDGSISEVGEKK